MSVLFDNIMCSAMFRACPNLNEHLYIVVTCCTFSYTANIGFNNLNKKGCEMITDERTAVVIMRVNK